MTLWAIVPVKPLGRGKSRLASVLSQQERADLNRHLLAHTVDTLRELPEI
jgi:2-phospho-L-lactate/phosphoenolpyruvate guanylyltransferase